MDQYPGLGAAEGQAGARHKKRLDNLPQRTYGLRTLGMGLGALPIALVLVELQSHWLAWAWMAFACLLWPHLAYQLSSRSRDPLRAELRNLAFDSFIAGSFVPLMHFNALPSVVLLTVVMADKINTGIHGLWLRSLPGMLLAIAGGSLLTGFAFQPQTSMAVLLASLPILVIHTLAVSISSYRLIRRVQRQNLQLEELSRVDTLTGLSSRGHWQVQAEALLHRHHADGGPACLVLLDVDEFKDINDRHGHAVGDDVLRGIAGLIRDGLPLDGHAGRLGGDEFAMLLPLPQAMAESAAESLRGAVEALRLAHAPGLQCSISAGIAPPPDAGQGLREWLESADRALYRAKHAGRNRTAASEA